jgi:hypothetical protein
MTFIIRVKRNSELRAFYLYSFSSIIRMRKPRRLRWERYAARMQRKGIQIGY